MILNATNRILRKFGYLIKKDEIVLPPDIANDKPFLELYNICKPYTMTSVERMYVLYNSMNYTLANHLDGDFVECGVWKGGSSLMIALMLKRSGRSNRKIYMYDTFEGMSEPTEVDKTNLGEDAKILLEQQDKLDESSIWCYSTIDEVKRNLSLSGFPEENMIFVEGKVEDTLARVRPPKIALLRLDTDWYESTKAELQALYPLLSEKGIMIIDDFGHWEGAKKAVMEYFQEGSFKPFINRIDYTGRLIIK